MLTPDETTIIPEEEQNPAQGQELAPPAPNASAEPQTNTAQPPKAPALSWEQISKDKAFADLHPDEQLTVLKNYTKESGDYLRTLPGAVPAEIDRSVDDFATRNRVGIEQRRNEAYGAISATPSFLGELEKGNIKNAAGIAVEALRRPFSALIGPTQQELNEGAIPWGKNPDGTVHYEYKPLGNAIDKHGLLPAISEWVFTAGNPLNLLRSIALKTRGEDVTPEALEEFKQKERAAVGLTAKPGDAKWLSALKGISNSGLNIAELIENPAVLAIPQSRLLSGAFAADMARHLPEQFAQVQEAAKTPAGSQARWESALNLASSVVLTTLAANHAVPGGGRQVADAVAQHAEDLAAADKFETEGLTESAKATREVALPKLEETLTKFQEAIGKLDEGAPSEKDTSISDKPSATGASETPKADEVASTLTAEGQSTELPASFVTSKGSEYQVHEDGTTTRNKSVHPEHPGDEGLKPRSTTTFYATPEQIAKLGEVQARGEQTTLAPVGDGQWGVKYLTGKDAGKFEKRTVTEVSKEPAVGLHPVEIWEGQTQPHFGNEITEVRPKSVTPLEAKNPEIAAQLAAERAKPEELPPGVTLEGKNDNEYSRSNTQVTLPPTEAIGIEVASTPEPVIPETPTVKIKESEAPRPDEAPSIETAQADASTDSGAELRSPISPKSTPAAYEKNKSVNNAGVQQSRFRDGQFESSDKAEGRRPSGAARGSEAYQKSPAEMSPDEFAKFREIETDDALRSLGGSGAEKERVRKEMLAENDLAHGSYLRAATDKFSDHLPVSAEAHDKYFGEPPAGYIREGELYVFKNDGALQSPSDIEQGLQVHRKATADDIRAVEEAAKRQEKSPAAVVQQKIQETESLLALDGVPDQERARYRKQIDLGKKLLAHFENRDSTPLQSPSDIEQGLQAPSIETAQADASTDSGAELRSSQTPRKSEYEVRHFNTSPFGGGEQIRVILDGNKIVGAQSLLRKTKGLVQGAGDTVFGTDLIGKTLAQAEKITGYKSSKVNYKVSAEKFSEWQPESLQSPSDIEQGLQVHRKATTEALKEAVKANGGGVNGEFDDAVAKAYGTAKKILNERSADDATREHVYNLLRDDLLANVEKTGDPFKTTKADGTEVAYSPSAKLGSRLQDYLDLHENSKRAVVDPEAPTIEETLPAEEPTPAEQAARTTPVNGEHPYSTAVRGAVARHFAAFGKADDLPLGAAPGATKDQVTRAARVVYDQILKDATGHSLGIGESVDLRGKPGPVNKLVADAAFRAAVKERIADRIRQDIRAAVPKDRETLASKADDPDAIDTAAIRMPDGKIFTGWLHGHAIDKADQGGDYKGADFARSERGYITNSGHFLNADEALKTALAKKQIDADAYKAAIEREGVLNPDEKWDSLGLEATVFDYTREDAIRPEEYFKSPTSPVDFDALPDNLRGRVKDIRETYETDKGINAVLGRIAKMDAKTEDARLQKMLARALSEVGDNAPVKIDPSLRSRGANGEFNPFTGDILASPYTSERGLQTTFLHEKIHSVLFSKVEAFVQGDHSLLSERDFELLNELEDLRQLALEQPHVPDELRKVAAETRLAKQEQMFAEAMRSGAAGRELYGLTSLHEFTAEITNSGFQKFLNDIKLPEAAGVPKGQTLWQRIKQVLRGLVFGDKRVANDSALAHAFDKTLDLLKSGTLDDQLALRENALQSPADLKQDAERQSAFLSDFAKAHDFEDVNDVVVRDPELFNEAAALYRETTGAQSPETFTLKSVADDPAVEDQTAARATELFAKLDKAGGFNSEEILRTALKNGATTAPQFADAFKAAGLKSTLADAAGTALEAHFEIAAVEKLREIDTAQAERKTAQNQVQAAVDNRLEYAVRRLPADDRGAVYAALTLGKEALSGEHQEKIQSVLQKIDLTREDLSTIGVSNAPKPEGVFERASAKVRDISDTIGGKAIPKLTRAGVMDEAVQHASARQYVPALIEDLLAKVFPDRYKDAEAMTAAVDIIKKDNILGGYDAAVKELERLKTEAPGSKAAQDQAEFVATIESAQDLEQLDTDVRASVGTEIEADIKRWGEHVSSLMDTLYNELKGVDPETPRETRGRHYEARMNLLPLNEEARLAQFTDQTQPLPQITVSNYRNPNIKRDKFMRQATLTGEYSSDPHLVLLNSLGGRWNEATKLRFYNAFERAGIGKIVDAGDPVVAEIAGQPAARLPIKYPQTNPKTGQTQVVEKSLYVPRELIPEIRSVLNTDGRLIENPIFKALTQVQLLQLADAAAHTKNIHSVIVNSLGSENTGRDLLRKVPILGTADAIREISTVAKQIASDSPDIRAEIANLAKRGMVRPEYPVTGIQKITRMQQLIHDVDTAARVIMNRRFDNLVERGLAAGTIENRRNFVQQIGEYNRRLMNRQEAFLRDFGISPFIVAGRTFNRFSRRLVAGQPGFETPDVRAEIAARTAQLSGLLLAATVPALVNMFTTGSMGGRAGTPIGAIDFGPGFDTPDHKRRLLDVMQLVGIRRGLRGLGIDAAIDGFRQGQKVNDIAGKALEGIVQTTAHPYVGPGLGAVYQVLTGHRIDLRARRVSIADSRKFDGAKQYVENFRVALKEQNPFIYGIVQTPLEAAMTKVFGIPPDKKDRVHSVTQTLQGLVKSPLSAVGYKEVAAKKKKKR